METDANKNEKRRKEDRSVIISAVTTGGEEVPILNLEDERPIASPKREKEGRSVMLGPTAGGRSVMMAPSGIMPQRSTAPSASGGGRSVMMAPTNGQRSVMMAPQQSADRPKAAAAVDVPTAQRSVMMAVTAAPPQKPLSIRQKASTSLRQKAKAVASVYQKLKDSSTRQRKTKEAKAKAQLQATQTPSQRTISQSQRQKKKKKKKPEDMTITAAEPSVRKESPAEQLRKELNEGAPYKKTNLEFDYEAGQQLGIRLQKTKKDLMVILVDQRPDSSPLWNKIRPGDCILTVNGRAVTSSEGFYEAIRRSTPNGTNKLSLGINRQIRTKPVSENRQKRLNIPSNSKGDHYYTAYLVLRSQAQLGIAVKAQNERVVLLRVDELGLGAGALEIGDVVLDVDGIPVKSTVETKKLIVSGLQSRGFVSVVVMHPMTEESLNISRYPLLSPTKTFREILGNAGVSNPADPDMKIDAVLVGRAEVARRKRGDIPKAPKILVKEPAKQNRQQRSVSLADKSNYVVRDIHSDVDKEDWSELESVPGRVDVDWKPSKTIKDRLKCLFTRFGGGSS